jgi:hypothetical protein
MGWKPVSTPTFTVKNGETVTLSLSVECSATAWWSADHFTLTLESIPDVQVGVDDILSAPNPMGAVRYYDLSGRSFATPPSPGLYLVNGRKILIK